MEHKTEKLNDNINRVVLEAYRHGFSVQSNFAREKAAHVAMAASMGLITTKIFSNVYGREWLPTVTGLQMLNDLTEDSFPDEAFIPSDDDDNSN